ncbi:MAG: sulfite dehydrogenase [Acidiferrobacterales bacterium]
MPIRRITTSGILKKVAEEGRKLPVAERRNFLKTGIALAGGTLVGSALTRAANASEANLPPNVPSWTKSLGPGVVTNPYGKPSRFEKHIVRRNVPWLTADRIASVSFTPLAELDGIITPNSLVFERHHAGIPDIDPEQHRLMVHGLVSRPVIFTVDDLRRFPSTSMIRFLECPANGGMEWRGAQMDALQFTHGMLSCCEWTGVLLSTLLQEVGIQKEAAWVLAEGADGSHMSRSIPLEKAIDDALIVYAQNGEPLRPEQGYPIRLLNPGWEGNTCVKWLRRLEIGDKPWYHREETSKYTDLLADGRARKFSFVQECNSVVTFPCPEKPVKDKGRYEVEGLAWSGQGKITRVDVSFDGGINWRSAGLKGLVLPKALTRFGMEWNWDGGSAMIQSRAVDETGYVQPTYTQLRDARGSSSIYHKNAIHTWRVHEDGKVTNVQIS